MSRNVVERLHKPKGPSRPIEAESPNRPASRSTESATADFLVDKAAIEEKMRKPPGKPRKMPSREEVVRLYVEEGLSTTQIAKMFGSTCHHSARLQLVRAGVPRRRAGIVRRKACKVEGCFSPVFDIYHKALGVWYGTMCRQHRAEHYRLLNRYLTRKKKGIPVIAWEYEDEAIQSANKEEKCLIQVKRQIRQVRERIRSLRDVSQSPAQEFKRRRISQL